MKVIRYKHCRENWEWLAVNKIDINWIDLQDTNLVVGKNASGKSITSRILDNFKNIFLPGNIAYYGEYFIDLIDYNNIKYIYYIKWENGLVKQETLHVHGELKINRTEQGTKIYSNTKNEFIEVSPPANKPVIQVRRDKKEHPYFEELATWAEGIDLIPFADAHPVELSFGNKNKIDDALDYLSNNELEKEKIIFELNSIGYNVRVIDIVKNFDKYILFIEEEGITYRIKHFELSQGMFRSLLILMYLHYLIVKQKASLIIIDDLCEGLDYDRASSLGKLIFNKMKANNVQFIATSNDYFLMNSVSINDWNIISRRDNKIISHNYQNSKKLFDEFKFTGMNNFQLFASDYLENPY